MDAKTVAAITRMEQSRAKLNAVLDKIAPQMEIYPTWKVKQVMDHIAGWDEAMGNQIVLNHENGFKTLLIPKHR